MPGTVYGDVPHLASSFLAPPSRHREQHAERGELWDVDRGKVVGDPGVSESPSQSIPFD